MPSTSNAAAAADSSLKPARIEKWDILKAVLIFLVVLGHFVNYYTGTSSGMRSIFLFIYMFHMPCFMFVSGLFSKKNVDEKRYYHIFSYLVMYIFIKVLICVTTGIIRHNFTFNLFSTDGVAWYALALFWCSLVTIFLKKLPKVWVLIAAIVLACVIGYDSNISDFLVLSRTIVFFPFFFAGYGLDPQKLAEKLSAHWMKIVGAAILVALAFVCIRYGEHFYYLRGLLTGRHPYSVIASTYGMDNLAVYGGLMRLAQYAVTAVLCFAVIAVIPLHIRFGKRLFAMIGRNTLSIYALHRPILYILYEGINFNALLAAAGIGHWVIIPIALLLTLLLGLPFWEKPMNAIIYPYKRIKDASPGHD